MILAIRRIWEAVLRQLEPTNNPHGIPPPPQPWPQPSRPPRGGTSISASAAPATSIITYLEVRNRRLESTVAELRQQLAHQAVDHSGHLIQGHDRVHRIQAELDEARTIIVELRDCIAEHSRHPTVAGPYRDLRLRLDHYLAIHYPSPASSAHDPDHGVVRHGPTGAGK